MRVGLERPGQLVDVHAVVVPAHADDLDAVELEDLDRAEESWHLDDDGVTRLEERAGRNIEPLGRTARDEDIVRLRLDAALGDAPGDELAQREVAELVTVGEASRGIFPRFCRSPLQAFDRHAFRRRRAVAEVDRIRMRLELAKDVGPDGRAEHGGALGESLRQGAGSLVGCGGGHETCLPGMGPPFAAGWGIGERRNALITGNAGVIRRR